MNTRKFSVTLFSLALCVYCTAAPCQITRGWSGDVESLRLSNQFLAFEIIPLIQGAIANMEHLPQGRKLNLASSVAIERVDLLPDRYSIAPDILQLKLWGVPDTKIITEMQVVETSDAPEGVSVTLSADFYAGQPGTRAITTISLPDNASYFTIDFTVRNLSSGTREYSPWFNGVPQMSDNKTFEAVIVPVRREGKNIRGRSMFEVPVDGLFVEQDLGNRNMFFAPLRPWLARFTPGKAGVLVYLMMGADLSNMMLYTHKNLNLHTMESIATPRKIPADDSFTWRYGVFFFSRLRGLREIIGHYGIDWRDGKLQLESCKLQMTGKLVINGQGFTIPASGPGELLQFPCANANLDISINEENIQLPELIQ